MSATSRYEPAQPETVWEAENNFVLNSDPSRIARILGHYELYKQIVDLPGAIVECGVFKGASLIRFASFRHYLENDQSRQIVGFDAFGAFPIPADDDKEDSKFIERFEGAAGQGISRDGLETCLERKGFKNVTLVEGDVTKTVPTFLDQNQHLRIALLHLDMDVYLPTKHCLEAMYDLVVPGGLIVIDDYSSVAGASRATEEFIAPRKLALHKAKYYSVPSYFIKPC